MGKGPRTSNPSVDTPDADLLGMLGADSLGRLKRLEERLIQPHGVVLDVCAVLRNSVRRRRTILTVPWVVEFLSMLDFIGPLLLCYRLNRNEEMCYLNKLLLVSVLGWLFQVSRNMQSYRDTLKYKTWSRYVPDCPDLFPSTFCEFRKLLAAFVSGSTARSGGIIRKITPTSAELKDTPTANRSQQKMQVNQLHGDSVLTTSENITRRLAAEKACSWLSANITGADEYSQEETRESGVLPSSLHGGVAVDPSAGPEPPVSDALEQLAELWERGCCSSVPLHELFTPLTVTAVLKARDTEAC
ncbi:hypothetical protein GOODEAATRI_010185 [Goodea atripinnis]|uniref:Uncharacterized protein n=1 Tax=Goodea atripinnis TaxID=208336 RepID=A0ABV0NJB8_9TELE